MTLGLFLKVKLGCKMSLVKSLVCACYLKSQKYRMYFYLLSFRHDLHQIFSLRSRQYV